MMSILWLHLVLLTAVTLIAAVIQLFARYREQSRDRLSSPLRHPPRQRESDQDELKLAPTHAIPYMPFRSHIDNESQKR